MTSPATRRAGRGWRRPARVPARQLVPAVISGTAAAAAGVGLLATSGWLITRAAERPPVLTLSIAIGCVQAFALGRGLARYAERLSVHGLALTALGTARLRLFDSLEPRTPAALGADGAGAALAGFVSDTEAVATAFSRRITGAIDITASVLLGALVAALIDPMLGAVLLAGAVATVLATVALARAARASADSDARVRAELAGAVLDTMRSARELLAYGREDLLTRRLAWIHQRSRAAAWRRALTAGAGRAAGVCLAGGSLIAVVAAGLAAHDAGRLSGVMLAVAAFVTLAVFDQLAGLALMLDESGAGRAAAARIAGLAAAEPPSREPAVDHSPPPGPVTARLDGVTVTLGRSTALDRVSLTLRPGQRLALTGPSGAGKTTVLHTLLRFVSPGAGRASIGGTDVAEMSRPGIARHVGWMADESYLFAASLRDNLRLASPAAADSTLRGALRRVGLSGWLGSLPDGLGTMLGAGGQPVSAGERQRLGMARALLTGGTVLLLDEPTAHLDPASAAEILPELLRAAGGRSVLVVSHDPAVSRYVDGVLTLTEGRLSGGSPAG